MRVLRVLPFVLAATLRNRVKHQLRRLRQPRYALATVVGLAWFWFYAGRHLVSGPMQVSTMPVEFAPMVTLVAAGGGTVLLLLGWVFRAKHHALAMSEAEVQFLFPAPLTRVEVLHYRVLQLVAIGFVGTLFTTVIFGRAASGRPVFFALGAWITFATMDLHRLGIALTWAAVGEGWSGLRRRAGTFAFLLTALAFTAWAATQVVAPQLAGLGADARSGAEGLRSWAPELARSVLDSPLRLALWPGLTLAGLVLARTFAEFLSFLPGALALLGLHYLWVIRSGVAFEEAAVVAAERRARAREAYRKRRGGAPQRKGSRKEPFRLGARGPVEVAFVWKALIATGWGRLLGRAGIAALAVSLGLAAWFAGPAGLAARMSKGVGPIALAMWGFTVVFGPTVFRSDLRLDRQNLDVLRALPVSGERLVRGQILGSAVHAVAAQWLLLPVVAASMRWAGPPGSRLWLLAAAAVLGPAVSLVNVVLQNAVVVALPGWVPREGERSGGPEAAGMRIVVAVGGFIALSLVVLPAAVVAALVLGAWWAATGTVTAPVVMLAAWIATAVLVGEAWLAAKLLGTAFDRLDPSEG